MIISISSGQAGSSSAARFLRGSPQLRQRLMTIHPFLPLYSTPTGTSRPWQGLARSPGKWSTCREKRQYGQWLRQPPFMRGGTSRPQLRQIKPSFAPWAIKRLTRPSPIPQGSSYCVDRGAWRAEKDRPHLGGSARERRWLCRGHT